MQSREELLHDLRIEARLECPGRQSRPVIAEELRHLERDAIAELETLRCEDVEEDECLFLKLLLCFRGKAVYGRAACSEVTKDSATSGKRLEIRPPRVSEQSLNALAPRLELNHVRPIQHFRREHVRRFVDVDSSDHVQICGKPQGGWYAVQGASHRVQPDWLTGLHAG